jgi:hypothetical protein
MDLSAIATDVLYTMHQKLDANVKQSRREMLGIHEEITLRELRKFKPAIRGTHQGVNFEDSDSILQWAKGLGADAKAKLKALLGEGE